MRPRRRKKKNHRGIHGDGTRLRNLPGSNCEGARRCGDDRGLARACGERGRGVYLPELWERESD